MTTRPGEEPDRIDMNDPAARMHWAKKLDVSALLAGRWRHGACVLLFDRLRL